jgi:beta-aspartyl-peptidase (threonine type)
VIASVVALEDDPLFNAGYGSVLTVYGRVEMDAGVMIAEHVSRAARAVNGSKQTVAHALRRSSSVQVRAGGVVTVGRVRNPIILARAVMESTPHLLIGGAGAEALAQSAGIKLCSPGELVSPRAHQQWLAANETRLASNAASSCDTVGAVARDRNGCLAAATSTGGVADKMAGRIGDSALIGAGLYASGNGAASATGAGEAIMRMASSRTVVELIPRSHPSFAASRVIKSLRDATAAEAGLIVIDSRGRIGYAHNAAAMEIAVLDARDSINYLLPPALPRMKKSNR